MNVYRLEVIVIDHDEVGAEEIARVLENAHYPNHCIAPHVIGTEVRDIGKWDDSLPINKLSTFQEEARKLFSTEQQPIPPEQE